MTIQRVKASAEARGIYFDGLKKWRNNCVGFAYEIFSPSGGGFFQAQTLQGLYNYIVKFPKIKKSEL